jgi:hypothetical protein
VEVFTGPLAGSKFWSKGNTFIFSNKYEKLIFTGEMNGY